MKSDQFWLVITVVVALALMQIFKAPAVQINCPVKDTTEAIQ